MIPPHVGRPAIEHRALHLAANAGQIISDEKDLAAAIADGGQPVIRVFVAADGAFEMVDVAEGGHPFTPGRDSSGRRWMI